MGSARGLEESSNDAITAPTAPDALSAAAPGTDPADAADEQEAPDSTRRRQRRRNPKWRQLAAYRGESPKPSEGTPEGRGHPGLGGPRYPLEQRMHEDSTRRHLVSREAKRFLIEHRTQEKRLNLERKWLQDDPQYLKFRLAQEQSYRDKLHADLAAAAVAEKDSHSPKHTSDAGLKGDTQVRWALDPVSWPSEKPKQACKQAPPGRRMSRAHCLPGRPSEKPSRQSPFIEYETREKRMMLERKWLQEDPEYMSYKREALQREKLQKALGSRSCSDEVLYQLRTFYGPCAIKVHGKRSAMHTGFSGRPGSSPATLTSSTAGPARSSTTGNKPTGAGRLSEVQQMCAELEESRSKLRQSHPDIFPQETKEVKDSVDSTKFSLLKNRLQLWQPLAADLP